MDRGLPRRLGDPRAAGAFRNPGQSKPGSRISKHEFVSILVSQRRSPSAVKPGLAWARSARRARLRHRFGGSSRQADPPKHPIRCFGGGGSANAGSCQSWFNVEDRLSSKLPLAEAGLDCCAWIPPAPRLGIRRARLRVDLGSAGMKPFFEGEYACKRHLRSRPPAWREKAGLPLSNSRLTCLFVATCPRFRKTGTRASPHSDLWGILR